jgi:hypothetical protein
MKFTETMQHHKSLTFSHPTQDINHHDVVKLFWTVIVHCPSVISTFLVVVSHELSLNPVALASLQRDSGWICYVMFLSWLYSTEVK